MFVVCCGDVIPLGECPWGDFGIVVILIWVSEDNGGGEKDFCFVGVDRHAEGT